MSYIETLEREFLHNIPQQGKVEWIGIRPNRLLEVHSVSEVTAKPDTGLEGDHFKKSSSGKRQVTLIQQEHLDVVARILGKKEIAPEWLRRNIVVSGINLLALKHQQFQVGEVLLETTGICAPCSRMEENLGAGGYNSMRGHGGITAKILQGGQIKIGDIVRLALMS
jgi:MOSC domain-containing protein YiiM